MAETHQEIVKVWIAPGCIVCDACENDCPEVFDVQETTCLIRPPAMADSYCALIVRPGNPVRKLEVLECFVYHHGLRHLGELEHARALVGLGGMTG